jgi:amino acid transporter
MYTHSIFCRFYNSLPIKVIWSFNGYQNLNYGLSEVKNPRRTIRIAGPLAVGLVAALYMLANIGYFAGASLKDIRESGRLVAGLLIRNVYGEKAEQALSIFISFSALGNVLSTVCLISVILMAKELTSSRFLLGAVSIRS